MNLFDVEISTTRLLLKPVSIKYKENIFVEFIEEITIYMHPRSPQDISEIEAFINGSVVNLENGSELNLVVLKRVSQEFLGCTGLHNINQKDPELGIWLKKTAQGNKYGLEAIAAIKQWADTNLDYEYLRYPVARENIASRKIPEALGGKIAREYDKTNMSGDILHLIEYRVYKTNQE